MFEDGLDVPVEGDKCVAALLRNRFHRADLTRAELIAAELMDVNFLEAHLGGAVISQANLTGSRGLTKDQIESCIVDEGTKLPT